MSPLPATDAARSRRRPPRWLFALGDAALPVEGTIGHRPYRLTRTFKHDFFAATGLYEDDGRRAVIKFGRSARLLGLPLAWLGRRMIAHETRLYSLVDGLSGVPRLLGRCGDIAFAHEFVEGRDLRRDDRPADDFFPRLAALIDAIHARDIAYVDLEKRENILVGDDGRPYLIDFQISWHWPARSGGRTALARRLLSLLQASDRYHLYKHWRRMRPDQLSAEQAAAARPPIWIEWHRLIFRPITLARRRMLEWLGARHRGQKGRSEETRHMRVAKEQATCP
jgi:hypothetical protein